MQSNDSLPTSQPEQRRPRRRRRRSGFLPSQPQPQPQPLQQRQLQSNSDFDKAYFDCYAHLGVHEEMIKDRVRTETYRNAIMHYKDLIKGRVVLDVGCGTGILSIFCAQAGAKQVFAVEASDIALQAANVVEANNLSSIITVLHQRIEDVELKEKVDVIISEWMGYMLLHESMLGSVITARDRWLKPGGLILPSKATLYMAPFTHSKRHRESIDFWRNVYGIDMSAMIPLAKQHAFEEPSVETITGENILTLPHGVKYIDCYSITISELQSVSTIFKFNSMVKAPLHGFAFWFDVDFTNMGPVAPIPVGFQVSTSPVDNHTVNGSQGNGWRKRNLLLSTAPEDPPTHWQQTLIYFHDPLELEQNQLIEGKVTVSQNQLHARFLNISLEYRSGDRTVVKETVMR